MRRKVWKTLAAAVGVAVLAAAVALMPACDTGGGCDFDLETLNGDWEITTFLEFGDKIVNFHFEVSGETLYWWGQSWETPLVYTLERRCNTMTLTREPEETPLNDGCIMTFTEVIEITFSSPDEFTGTFTGRHTFSGSNCGEYTDEEETGEVQGIRLP